jgi:hypothetical protein
VGKVEIKKMRLITLVSALLSHYLQSALTTSATCEQGCELLFAIVHLKPSGATSMTNIPNVTYQKRSNFSGFGPQMNEILGNQGHSGADAEMQN